MRKINLLRQEFYFLARSAQTSRLNSTRISSVNQKRSQYVFHYFSENIYWNVCQFSDDVCFFPMNTDLIDLLLYFKKWENHLLGKNVKKNLAYPILIIWLRLILIILLHGQVSWSFLDWICANCLVTKWHYVNLEVLDTRTSLHYCRVHFILNFFIPLRGYRWQLWFPDDVLIWIMLIKFNRIMS